MRCRQPKVTSRLGARRSVRLARYGEGSGGVEADCVLSALMMIHRFRRLTATTSSMRCLRARGEDRSPRRASHRFSALPCSSSSSSRWSTPTLSQDWRLLDGFYFAVATLTTSSIADPKLTITGADQDHRHLGSGRDPGDDRGHSRRNEADEACGRAHVSRLVAERACCVRGQPRCREGRSRIDVGSDGRLRSSWEVGMRYLGSHSSVTAIGAEQVMERALVEGRFVPFDGGAALAFTGRRHRARIRDAGRNRRRASRREATPRDT